MRPPGTSPVYWCTFACVRACVCKDVCLCLLHGEKLTCQPCSLAHVPSCSSVCVCVCVVAVPQACKPHQNPEGQNAAHSLPLHATSGPADELSSPAKRKRTASPAKVHSRRGPRLPPSTNKARVGWGGSVEDSLCLSLGKQHIKECRRCPAVRRVLV